MLHAVLLAAAAEGFLSLMDAIIKSMTTRIGVLEIASLRFAFGTGWASLLVAVMRPGWPSRTTIAIYSARSVLGVFTATLFFYGLSELPLADAIALGFLSPLFMALLGVLLLGERLDLRIGLALLAGFVGMLVIIGGQIGRVTYTRETWLGAAAIVASALLYAFAIVLLRARATRDALSIIVLFQNLGPALLLAVPAWLYWTTPASNDLWLFLLLGLLGVSGHFCLTHAFSRAETARLAPVHYTTLVWGVLLGWLFFGDIPGVATLVGAGIIIAASLLMRRA